MFETLPYINATINLKKPTWQSKIVLFFQFYTNYIATQTNKNCIYANSY